jgi:sensor histidine kinase regulating citrate/malate metabolism
LTAGITRPERIEVAAFVDELEASAVLGAKARGVELTDRTGLGLAICAHGMTALHGAIRVRNQNRGCVFTVDLPRIPA